MAACYLHGLPIPLAMVESWIDGEEVEIVVIRDESGGAARAAERRRLEDRAEAQRVARSSLAARHRYTAEAAAPRPWYSRPSASANAPMLAIETAPSTPFQRKAEEAAAREPRRTPQRAPPPPMPENDWFDDDDDDDDADIFGDDDDEGDEAPYVVETLPNGAQAQAAFSAPAPAPALSECRGGGGSPLIGSHGGADRGARGAAARREADEPATRGGRGSPSVGSRDDGGALLARRTAEAGEPSPEKAGGRGSPLREKRATPAGEGRASLRAAGGAVGALLC